MQSRHQLVARKFGRAAGAVLCCALLVCGGAALAQSGRRQPKRDEIAPVPTPTPEPTPIPRVTTAAEQIQLLLLSEDTQSFNARDYAYLMRDAVSQRLREAKSFDIVGGGKSASRGEAHKLAKLEKKRSVVWFRLVIPGQFGQPDIAGQSSQDASIEFIVLEPETGKQKASGRAYLNSRRAGIGRGGIGIPGGGGGLPGGCYPSGTTREGYYIVEASIEAADRVIQHFGVTVPQRCS